MKHRAPVLNAAILVLVFAAAVAAQSGGGDRSAPSTEIEQLRLAAEQGDARAQNNLGRMYAAGVGVAHDYQEALKWFRLAAEQGVAVAQYNLGRMYANRRVMDADGYPVLDFYVQAHKWINLAASRTTGEEGDFRSVRDKLEEQMTASQVAEAQRFAREWQPKTWEQLKGIEDVEDLIGDLEQSLSIGVPQPILASGPTGCHNESQCLATGLQSGPDNRISDLLSSPSSG